MKDNNDDIVKYENDLTMSKVSVLLFIFIVVLTMIMMLLSIVDNAYMFGFSLFIFAIIGWSFPILISFAFIFGFISIYRYYRGNIVKTKVRKIFHVLNVLSLLIFLFLLI